MLTKPLQSALATDGADRLTLPAWVPRLFGGQASLKRGRTGSGVQRQCLEGNGWMLLSLCAPRVAEHSPQDFQHVTTELYRHAHQALGGGVRYHPVRLWNFIPQIHAPQGNGLDRYMVFNTGRHDAYTHWYEDARTAEQSMPTATGVGHDGRDLLVHVLACTHTGRPVENPRQVSAYHYSQRYGPKPPCFARATVVSPWGAELRILVGGTASVVGEDSRHEHEVVAQAHETFTNLSELIRAADGTADLPAARRQAPQRLRRFTDLRVYYMRPSDQATLKVLIRENFPTVREIEWCRADLCRSELLVEIEGVAEVKN